QDAVGRERAVDASIGDPIAVVPRAAVHVNDGRKWSASFGLIDASQPGLASQVLILDVPLVYFEFAVGFHAGTLSQACVDLQAPQSGTGTAHLKGGHGNRRHTRRGN